MRRIKALVVMAFLCSLCLIFLYSSLNLHLAHRHRALLEVSANPRSEISFETLSTKPVPNYLRLTLTKDSTKSVPIQVTVTPTPDLHQSAVFAALKKAIPQNTAYWNRVFYSGIRRLDKGGNSTRPEALDWSHCRHDSEQLRTNIHDFTSYPELHQDFLLGMECRNPPILIDQPEKCTSEDGETFLLLAIKSTPRNFEQRQAVRETWGREALYGGGVRVRTVFLLGSSSLDEPDLSQLLVLEARHHGDLLQWDFHDSFFNLTLKEQVFYRWVLSRCPKVSFVFKGDDDVFANTEAILGYLQSLEPNKNSTLYLGQIISTASPLRDSKSKYYIPPTFYDGPYPAYAGGGGYLFSGSLIRPLYGVSKFLPFYPIDDVYSGMCFNALGILPEAHDGFQTFDIREQDRENPCVHKDLLLVHRRSPRQIIRLWRSIHNPVLIC
ncbi:N-acetyllactosaminide beta-1,3-N-acetylglucosaminyltransferase 2 [Oncorhynchus clarkii lewisi]|uniref:N-acetyllactosaminide beta-1,3-N-acetylglucosaminyltransferase 2 n=1 Tax=Oncorhynchus clarkii lewisi TaxID=490388 RepID=UPI0039B95788